MRTVLFASLAVLGLASCASSPRNAADDDAGGASTAAAGTATNAIANVSPASGSLVSGRLQLMAMGKGVHIYGELGGLAPNSTHGFHIHEKGDCSAADASSAGGHFNPAGVAHGNPEAPPHHAGDLDNITADANGVARINAHVPNVSLGGDPAHDILNRALVVHADADDYRSQPSGNSGARIACGVITAQP
jgi:Cu-Zn family superoxide dismutase